MARPAAKFLTEAMSRTVVVEDRLTEVLAHALALDRELRAAFLAALGVPVEDDDDADVSTQRRILVERRVDLEVPTRDENDPDVSTQRRILVERRVDLEVLVVEGASVKWAVWFEVKAGAEEQPEQLSDYARELARLYPGRSTFVVLAPEGDATLDSAETVSPSARSLTWPEAGRTLSQVGEGRERGDWRRAAIAPTAPAAQRVLFELLHLIETTRGVAPPMNPLAVEDAAVAKNAEALLKPGGTISALLDAAIEQVPHYAIAESSPSLRQKMGSWHSRRLALDSGAAGTPWPLGNPDPDWQAKAEVLFGSTDRWVMADKGAREQPMFVAGFVFEPASDTVRAALTDPAWAVSLPKEIVYSDERTHLRLCRCCYLSEVAVWGTSLSEQAVELGTWVKESYAAIAALEPPTSLVGRE